jgi:signal transduction histidine kinase
MRSGLPLILKLFLTAVVVPSLVLAYLSFRSIQNESLLTEKKKEEEVKAFIKAMEKNLDKELGRLLSEVKKKSGFLFDQPQTVTELGKSIPFDEIQGVQALFLYRGQERNYPFLRSSSRTLPPPGAPDLFESLMLRLSPDSELHARVIRSRTPNLTPAQQIQNWVGILRLHQQVKNWPKVISICKKLHNISQSGFLTANIRSSVSLSWFEALKNQKLLNKSIDFALNLISDFYLHSEDYDLQTMQFVFDRIFNSILSYEHIENERRESLWNIRKALKLHIDHTNLFNQHRDDMQVLESMEPSPSGMSYLLRGGNVYFKMSFPFLPGNQSVLGIFDKKALYSRLSKSLKAPSREWRDIPFRIQDEQGDIIMRRDDSDSLNILYQGELNQQFPRWSLTLYQRNSSEIQKESQKKMILLYTLVGFSLLILITGTFFTLRGLNQQRHLLNMKSNFLSSVSHELKTPLTSIRMFSEMMENGRVKKIEKMAQYAGHIGKEANRLDTLIQSILSYTRMEHGKQVFKMESIDLSQILHRAMESHAPRAKSKQQQMLVDSIPECVLEGDYSALLSLLQNLIDNAIKYTPEYGTIEVTLSEENKKYFLFQVKDSGVGIPLSDQKHIFDDFYRVGDEMTRTTKGSGLGLAIVKRVADAHNAQISVDSKPGKGTTFTVRFKKRVDNEL